MNNYKIPNKIHLELAEHYSNCLQKHGDSAIGMDWPNELQTNIRHAVMTEIFKYNIKEGNEKLKILDFACGTSHYFNYLKDNGFSENIEYTGIDINPDAILIAKDKFPKNNYMCVDVLESVNELTNYDYIIINGLFTQKRSMSEVQMQQFLIGILTVLFPYFSKGLAFNAMSSQVDYRKKEAFHLDLNWITQVLVNKFSRKFIVRHDYELYENTIFIFKG
jgi:SAM-dependent methyltransferase